MKMGSSGPKKNFMGVNGPAIERTVHRSYDKNKLKFQTPISCYRNNIINNIMNFPNSEQMRHAHAYPAQLR